jgi:ABC-type antimicrobial peptide transport system permease subunit
MFKTYLRTAIRHLARHKTNSIVNISGLIVGFTAFLLIFLVIGYENSFDDFHPNGKNIYRVVRAGKTRDDRDWRTGVPFPVTDALKKEFPQLANAAAIFSDNNVQVNIPMPDGMAQKKFKEATGVYFAQPSFLQMFNFPLIEGNSKTAIHDPNTVLLTKNIAAKYFGDWTKATGRSLKMDGITVKVTGILDNPPVNTDFPITAILSYATLDKLTQMNDWGSISDPNYCFVQLQDNASPARFDHLLTGFTDRHIRAINPGYDLVLQPLKEIHYDSRLGNFTGRTFRRSLVVFQFVIAQMLIIGTLVVASQMDYFRNADLGLKKDAIITARFPNDSLGLTKMDHLRNELYKTTGIIDVSFSKFAPAGINGWYTDLRLPANKTPVPEEVVEMKPADTSYFNVYGLQLLAGRRYFSSDTMRELVVNEAVLRGLHIRDPKDAIGRIVNVAGRLSPIVGVVKDFHTNSLRDPINYVVLTTMRNDYSLVNVKIDLNNAKSVIANMESLWNKNFPDYVFEYSFIDQDIAKYYKQENQLSQIYKIFAGIAIFISCLGLFGLISFMAVQRKKEIGIRKVLGAPVRHIVVMLSKEFALLIVIAFLISAPIAWYFMQQWLQQYTYRITLGTEFFIATILSSLCIAWLTVGYTAIKAARANPVNSLRTE